MNQEVKEINDLLLNIMQQQVEMQKTLLRVLKQMNNMMEDDHDKLITERGSN